MIQPVSAGSVLPEPYGGEPNHEAVRVTPAVAELVRAQVQALALSSDNFASLSPEQQQDIIGNMEKICAYIAALVQEDFRIAEKLGLKPMLRERITLRPPEGAIKEPAAAPAQALAGTPKPPPPPPPEEFSPRAAGLVAGITGETIRAIAFPSFVADLIRGTFQAIVNASIQQMEAYANLLSNVAKTVDQFMADNISDSSGRNYLVSRYPAHFSLDTTSGSARLRVKSTDIPKPNFQQDLELPEDVDLDDETAEETLMPAARRQLARQRQSLLSTMVMMGINRIVITSGHIRAEMGFHIVAQDTGKVSTYTSLEDENKELATFGGMFGPFGMGGAAYHSTVYVSTTKKDSTDDLKVNADLTGEVDLKFKSDYLPIERFANPTLISVIQGNTYNPAANQPTGSKTAQETAPATTPAH
jgi:hypothetical protein